GVWKAAQKASPTVLNTTPSFASMQERSSASCRSRADCIASRCCSQRLVLLSTSVKRKVTVPVGSELTSTPHVLAGAYAASHRAPSTRYRSSAHGFNQSDA